MGNIEKAVKEDFGPLNPREDVSLERMSSLILDVRRKVEGATPEERK
jgi:peroxin-3